MKKKSYTYTLGNKDNIAFFSLFIPESTRLVKTILTLILCASLCITNSSYALNLWQAYVRAQDYDPQYQISKNEYLATRENLPIAKANLLPNISLSGNAAYHNRRQNTPTENRTTSFNSNAYALALQQPIFDKAAWQGMKEASDEVKAALADFEYARQDLMKRVTGNYLDVLAANKLLTIAQRQQQADSKLLQLATIKLHNGFVKPFDVADAKEALASDKAQVATRKQQLVTAKANLAALLRQPILSLASFTKSIPLIKPLPATLSPWINKMQQQNYDIKAKHFAILAKQTDIKVKQAGHYPTIEAGASYDGNRSENNGLGTTIDQGTSLRLQLNLPIYEGGRVTSQTKQATYRYDQSQFQLAKTYETTLNQLTQGFWGVINNIDTIKAKQQAIKSNQDSLNNKLLHYKAGTANLHLADIINAQQKLFNNQQQLWLDYVNYLKASINLKLAAGTLNPTDLQQINQWLH